MTKSSPHLLQHQHAWLLGISLLIGMALLMLVGLGVGSTGLESV